MNNKYVIYTGIFGGYDHLIEPQVELHENIHLVCFTNNPELTSKKWKVIMIGDDNISDHMLNRKVKVLPTYSYRTMSIVYMWMAIFF